MSDRPSVDPIDDERSPMDDIFVALRGSGTLEILGLEEAELDRARTDAQLFETLRIAHEVLLAIKDGGALDTFLRLPMSDKSNFLRWVGMIDDPELRRLRTATFITALSESPLAEQN